MKMSKLLSTAFIAASVCSSQAALVAHFTFDNSVNLGENTGSASTGWSNFSGISQTTGRFGTGAGSFVAGTSSAWDNDFTVANLDSFSVSMHVKSTQSAAWDDFLSIGTGNATVLVLERTGAEGVAVYNIGNVGGTSEGQVVYAPGSGTFDVDDGSWHHLGISVGDGNLSLYVDGVNRGTVAYSGTGAISAFQLASRFGDGSRAITTEIDDVAVYNETLTDAQMAYLSANQANAAAAIPEPSGSVFATLAAFGLLVVRRRS